MAKKARAKTASKRPERKSVMALRLLGERYTPLLSRQHYTFSRMRIDRGSPQTCTAICFRGWVRA